MLRWAGVAAAAALAYLAMSPLEVNGDGIGYLKAVRDGARYPGHLGYVPLLSLLLRWAQALGLTGGRLIDGVLPARVLSACSAGATIAIVGALVERHTREPRRGLIAALGLFASAGLWLVGVDIESYAPALLSLMSGLALVRKSSILSALALSGAVLMHVESSLFLLVLLVLSPRHRDRVTLVVVLSIVLTAAGLVGLGIHGLLGATHGFRYPLHVYTPLLAVWGALRTLVMTPYLYEASLPRVITGTVLGALCAGALVALSLLGDRKKSPFSTVAVLSWVLPYTAVGLWFFASDSERWLFLLPLVWITVASMASLRRLAFVVAALLACNLAVWIPQARDARAIERASSFARALRPGDLVVSPGHGWDESIALYADGVVPFPLVFHAAARGGLPGLAAALDEALTAARARGASVVTARLDGGEDPSGTLGWKELAVAGIDREAIAALLQSRGIPTRR